jgi:5-methylcytosine-specific restriction endonuclease McrA
MGMERADIRSQENPETRAVYRDRVGRQTYVKRVPCVTCGTPHAAGQPCPRCGNGTLSHADELYRVNRRTILATATHCHLCGEPFVTGDRVTVDHITPIAVGGDHSLENLAAAHERCNKRKGAT